MCWDGKPYNEFCEACAADPETAQWYRQKGVIRDERGMEAARRLKDDNQTNTIPIIAVTAFAMSGDEVQILASGCDGYLSKPFRIGELLTLVEHWTTSRA